MNCKLASLTDISVKPIQCRPHLNINNSNINLKGTGTNSNNNNSSNINNLKGTGTNNLNTNNTFAKKSLAQLDNTWRSRGT